MGDNNVLTKKEKEFLASLNEKALTVSDLNNCVKIWKNHHKFASSFLGKISQEMPAVIRQIFLLVKSCSSNELSSEALQTLVDCFERYYNSLPMRGNKVLDHIMVSVFSTITIMDATFKQQIPSANDLIYLISLQYKNDLLFCDVQRYNALCRKASLGGKRVAYLDRLNALYQRLLNQQGDLAEINPYQEISHEDLMELRLIIDENQNHPDSWVRRISVYFSNNNKVPECLIERSEDVVGLISRVEDRQHIEALVLNLKRMNKLKCEEGSGRGNRHFSAYEAGDENIIIQEIRQTCCRLTKEEVYQIATRYDVELDFINHDRGISSTMDAILSPRELTTVGSRQYGQGYWAPVPSDCGNKAQELQSEFTPQSFSARAGSSGC